MLFNPDPKRTFMIDDGQDTNIERSLEFDRDIIIDGIMVNVGTDTTLDIAVMVEGGTLWSVQYDPIALGRYIANAMGFWDNGESLRPWDDVTIQPFVPIHCKRGDSIQYIIDMVAPANFIISIVYHSFYPMEAVWVTVP